MTKAKIERLMVLEKANQLTMTIGELIELGRLRQEFEMWEPEAATPAPEVPSVATSWKPLSFSDGTGVPRAPCTCGKPLSMVPPYPPCPVHGPRPHTIVTASCWLPPKEAE